MSLPLFFMSLFVALAGFAQEKKEVDITIGTEKNDSFFCSAMGLDHRSSCIHFIVGCHYEKWQ